MPAIIVMAANVKRVLLHKSAGTIGITRLVTQQNSSFKGSIRALNYSFFLRVLKPASKAERFGAPSFFLFCVLNLSFHLGFGFLIGRVRNAFGFTALQQEDTNDGSSDNETDPEPEIVFFLFHVFTSTDFIGYKPNAPLQ
jgi:hypothetical protein